MTKTILLVPGSLRKNSSSYKLIKKVVELLPAGYTGETYEFTGQLPHFNDADDPSGPVISWRKKVADAAGVVFITPEYAYGVPGTLKNALDWMVGSGEFVNKPTVLITAATGGEHAHKALLWILGALTAAPHEGCDLLISFIRSKVDDEGNIKDPGLQLQLSELVKTFITDIDSRNIH